MSAILATQRDPLCDLPSGRLRDGLSQVIRGLKLEMRDVYRRNTLVVGVDHGVLDDLSVVFDRRTGHAVILKRR